MSDLHNISLSNNVPLPFGSQPLNRILVGGSHDAGLWTVKKTGLAVFISDSFFITQTSDLLGQLCSGSRWFDIRLSKLGGDWSTFHGTGLIYGYGGSLSLLLSQLKAFYSYPKYSKEVITWRIKIGSGDDSNQLASLLRENLASYSVDKTTEEQEIQSMSLSDIWGQNRTQGHLILMKYSWEPPPVEIGKRKGWFWDYPSSQYGQFSDALTMNGMLRRCVDGQIPRLLSYRNLTTPYHPNNSLIGLWWTFTTEDVKSNTDNQWAAFPSGFTDFFVLSGGEIGNVLVSDFFSRYPQIMDVVYAYNLNKYGHYPGLPPSTGFSVLNNPVIPGVGLFNGTGSCDPIGSATDAFLFKAMAILILMVTVLGIILVGLITCAACKFRKNWYLRKKYLPLVDKTNPKVQGED
uniref:Phosphatidylinositol-specific phospholipase C X domain-containing protein n=1 Tax=Arcella intermedia TaxID=1963864 RepID=A0A6B2L5T6_9EUKA